MGLQRMLTGVIALVALFTGLLLIPRGDEHFTMLARDGRYEDASRALLSMRDAGDRRPQLLMQISVLQMKQGDVAGALASVETYLASRPEDHRAREVLADLLLQSGKLAEHLEVTDRLVRARPDPDRISRLLANYKLHGRTTEELALLKHFASTRYIRVAHLERLGALLSAGGDWDGAAHWLLQFDRDAPVGESHARLRLVHVLLKSGRADEALHLAKKWLLVWRSSYLSGKLISGLAQGGAEDGAIALAQLSAERMPETTFQIAGVLTQNSHAAVAREMLAHWSDRMSAPSTQDVRDYVHASLAAGEMRKPLQKLLQLVREKARFEIQASFVEEISHAYGTQVVAQLLPMLSQGVLLARSLLAADLARTAGNIQLAGWFLDRIDVSQLAAHQHEQWLSLLRELKPRHVMLERMLKLWENGQLPRHFVGIIAAEAHSAGRMELHDALWASVRRR